MGSWWLMEPATNGGLPGLADIPKLVTDLGWVGMAILVTYMFVTNRWYSRSQHEKALEQEKEIAALWKKAAEEQVPLAEQTLEALRPIAQTNEAILRIIEGMQTEQRIRESLSRERGRE